MSAFILTDNHCETIAHFINEKNHNIDAKELANRLKKINIQSVNYRYNEKTRVTKCKDTIVTLGAYTNADMVNLVKCWSYQSCEDSENIDFHIMDKFLKSFFTNEQLENRSSNVWAI